MRTRPGTTAIVSMVLMLFMGACARPNPREYLTASEQDLGLFESWYGSDHRIFHSALLYPHGRGLTVNGYLVGIEKAEQDKVGGARYHPEVLMPESDNTQADERFNKVRGRLTGNRKAHIITHLLRYRTETRAGGQGRMTQCALYSALGRPPDPRVSTDAAGRLFNRCAPPEPPSAGPPETPFATSWRAVETLRRSLATDLQNASPGYTDIIVYVMGWNTAQDQALENFNGLIGHLLDEADDRNADFRPLVIGVTWPSLWALGDWAFVPDAIVRFLSFVNKADDAEEIGTTWLREVVERAVLPAREEARRGPGGAGRPKPRVVLVGHSFGARALVSAITQHAQLQAPNGSGTDRRLDEGDRVVLLEGAFEIERLFDGAAKPPGGGAGAGFTRLPDFPVGNPRLTLTASKFDTAVSAAIWGWYAGDIDTYDHLCEAARDGKPWRGFEFSPFGCGSARKPPGGNYPYGFGLCKESGRTGLVVPLAGKRIRYFDASDLINCDAPFTGGGAHSDIYRRETARFILEEILSPP